MSNGSNIAASDLSVDATLKPTVSLPTSKDVINLESLTNIEKQLDTSEIISLVYLVIDERYYAYQQLLLLLRDPHASLFILQEWAKTNAEKDWQKILIEALCVIKNYKILKQLGFMKEICKQHFLPHIHKTSINLNTMRKTCYSICEKLGKQNTTRLLKYLENTTNQKFMKYEYQYLELFFLKIEIDNNRKIAEIAEVLKILGEEDLYCMLKEVDTDKFEPKPNGDTHEYDKADQIYESKASYISGILSNTSAHSYNSRPSTSIDTHARVNKGISSNIHYESWNLSPSIHTDEEHGYPIDFNNPGTVLIINQEHFYTEINQQYKHLLPGEPQEKLESRAGSGKDRDDLYKLFMQYGFKVIVENNLTHVDMESRIKEVVSNIREESSLFVCILSHGEKGVVYAANSCYMKVSNIQQILSKSNKKHLIGKPKVLIIQACQGDECQKVGTDTSDTEDEENEVTVDGPVPPATDMLTFWATVPGYAAIRDKKKGTWFIQTLCKVIDENSHNLHLSDICTKVVKEVTEKNYQKTGMTPMVVHTLRFPFYFPPLKK